jgi:hypothetical protein
MKIEKLLYQNSVFNFANKLIIFSSVFYQQFFNTINRLSTYENVPEDEQKAN